MGAKEGIEADSSSNSPQSYSGRASGPRLPCSLSKSIHWLWRGRAQWHTLPCARQSSKCVPNGHYPSAPVSGTVLSIFIAVLYPFLGHAWPFNTRSLSPSSPSLWLRDTHVHSLAPMDWQRSLYPFLESFRHCLPLWCQSGVRGWRRRIESQGQPGLHNETLSCKIKAKTEKYLKCAAKKPYIQI